MSLDAIVAIGVGVMIAVVWVLMASSWGFVHRIVPGGFIMRNMFGRKRPVSWAGLSGRVQHYSSFIPRLVVRLNSPGFFKLHRSFAIILRNRDRDRQFYEEVASKFEIVHVESLSDLYRR